MLKPAAPLPAALSFKAHPAAEIFPLMEGDTFTAFVEDIRKHGQHDPIVMLGDVLLDGRNRRRVCDILEIEPFVVEWAGKGDPVAFIVSRNLHRRHLTPSQRAMAAARLMNMPVGRPASSNSLNLDYLQISAQDAAKLFQVSRPHVFHAKTVIDHGTAEEKRQCDAGEASVSTTANAIRKRKIAAGEWEVKPRGRHKGEAVTGTAEIVQLHPSKSNHKLGPKLPDGVTPQLVARQAIALRDEGISVSEVCKRLHVADAACRQMIDIVLIADREDLSVRETQIAATALDRMDDRARSLNEIYTSIAPIARRLWGEAKQGDGINRKAREEARYARFDRGLGVILQSLSIAARIDVPHLSAEQAKEITTELKQTINSIKDLITRIGSIHA